MTKDTSQSIAALIDMLDGLLRDASHTSALAQEAIAADRRNEAIGTLLPVVEKLDAATALLRTILTLHRSD